MSEIETSNVTGDSVIDAAVLRNRQADYFAGVAAPGFALPQFCLHCDQPIVYAEGGAYVHEDSEVGACRPDGDEVATPGSAQLLPGIVVLCPDREIRHEGSFESFDAAYEFADLGHLCLAADEHEIGALTVRLGTADAPADGKVIVRPLPTFSYKARDAGGVRIEREHLVAETLRSHWANLLVCGYVVEVVADASGVVLTDDEVAAL